MAEILKSLNNDEKNIFQREEVRPSPSEPRNGEHFKIDTTNPVKPTDAGSRWVLGRGPDGEVAVYHCSGCSTSTEHPLRVFGPLPVPNCCIGPHVEFPYKR